ncbi:Protease inhibitor/seed storage/lipid transfer protein family protein [Quillaja saponaria]|uniref:Protease inhibitor/seed storage/lipid transfer protein family protein n=1 Tax=Quillaja saponaria TaxID=32244 RepID=A0AAD7PN42_QUISA|nr:Protease inhibitor/seed storage/lipid transfer protein family protein [Quillaja saponaria]
MGKWTVILVLLNIALMCEAEANAGGGFCNVDSRKLTYCLPAVSGESPPPPTKQCCFVVRHANLPCLCSYKSVLSALGINPKYAFALPGKCGLKTPPQCHAY